MTQPSTRHTVLSSSGAAALTILFLGVNAWAEHRLHQRVIDPTREESPLVEQPAEGRNPAALRINQMDMEVSEPGHRDAPRQGEQPFQDAAPPPTAESHQRLQQWRPDLQTARTADELNYHSAFTPSISPHKRISSLDQVGTDYTLSRASTELRDVPVGGTASEDRDLFWGSVLVRFVPNRPVPIPSVAPEARILSVRTRPDVPVRFHRDGAGNFYISSPHDGQTRVIFVTDAPTAYFGGPLPSNVRSSDVPVPLRPTLPTGVSRAADQVARRLGLDGSAPISRNLSRLIAYLRAFRNEPLDAPGGDPYLTLAFGQRGVCRHRAFVFVVTAQGLGIPARFITNEVHAFSEVFVPTVGWVRIDLGGEARLAPESEPVVQHQPRSPDPFPWPPGSRSPSENQRASGGHGQLARNGESPGQPEAGSSAGTEPGQPSVGAAGAPNAEAAEGTDTLPDFEESSTEAESTDELSPPSRRLAVVLSRHSAHVVRGESMALEGTVQSADGPVAGARVRLWLRTPASGQLIRLGGATCGADGHFRAHFPVPSSVPTGDYALVANASEPR